jgi:hypothetical protein
MSLSTFAPALQEGEDVRARLLLVKTPPIPPPPGRLDASAVDTRIAAVLADLDVQGAARTRDARIPLSAKLKTRAGVVFWHGQTA